MRLIINEHLNLGKREVIDNHFPVVRQKVAHRIGAAVGIYVVLFVSTLTAILHCPVTECHVGVVAVESADLLTGTELAQIDRCLVHCRMGT